MELISSPIAETERLRALEDFDILDSGAEKSYDDIVELAAFICGTPVSLISFVAKDRQWFKAEHGLGARETPREQSFCAHTIPHAKTLVVQDATQDERFRDNPLVTSDPSIRFYAGAPIVEKNGHVLGTLCVIDRTARTLTPEQISALEALARQVLILLEQRKAIAELGKTAEAAKQADLQVRQSRQSLETFVNTFPALAWIANADGWIYWYNRRWYEYTGTEPKDMEGWGWQKVHDPEVLPSVMERWTSSIKTGHPFEMVFPLKGADNKYRPFLTRIEPLRDEGGTIQQWFGTNIEVDALERMNLELRKSRAELNQVLDSTSDAVVSVNRAWDITYMNPQAETLYGAATNLIGQNLWASFPNANRPDSPFRQHFMRAMDEHIPGSFETDFGETSVVTLRIEVYPSDDGIVTFSRDVTQLKHAAAAVLQNEKLAAVGRLASSISHEINNPLEAVTNLLYLARTAQSTDAARPFLTQADLELRRVSAITSQTLRFHRQATRATEVSFAELVRGIFTGQHSRLANSVITVRERNRSTMKVLCFEGEIRQVLINFISNAIDAMHGSGGTLHLRGQDGQKRTGERGLFITIADTGTGMSESTQKRAFEAFYTTKGIGGTGLGLWISKEILDRHGAHLELRSNESAKHHGTVLRLFLPQRAEPIAAALSSAL